MKRNFSSAASVFPCLVFATLLASAQAAGSFAVYTTPPKLNIARVSGTVEKGVMEIRGAAAFTFTMANENGSVAGTLIYTIPENARQQIARLSGKPLNAIPASVVKKDMVAGLRKETSCPTVQLELGETEIEIAGVKAGFKRILVEMPESSDPLRQYVCAWTRQINAGRPHRGIAAAINRLLVPEPPERK